VTDAERNQAQALLVRAAEQEARRQAAHARRDWPAVASAEAELRALWRQHAELERRAERVA
jgi:hypothetical protein